MIQTHREAYNKAFSTDKYQAMLDYIASEHQHQPLFRIAETPVFLPDSLVRQLVEACEGIIDTIVAPDFIQKTEGAFQPHQVVPNENSYPVFLVLDFGICREPDGSIHPWLIEGQGFPSLFFYQDLTARAYRKYFPIPEHMTHLFQGMDSEEYVSRLRNVIIGDSNPENVVLLEVDPEKQATQIDFWATRDQLGLKVVNLFDVKKSGNQLYYQNEQGKAIPIERIYNRVIFDELEKRNDLPPLPFSFTEALDVDWVGHPNWFFRVSKYALPLFPTKYVPETHYLNTLSAWPDDLSQYVLKPLFSFAGMGVKIDVTENDLETIPDPENYILQKKVKYEPVIETPDGPSKCEVRMMYVWEPGKSRPTLMTNLIRLSKGIMTGVRYNKEFTWVGGSVGFFDKDCL